MSNKFIHSNIHSIKFWSEMHIASYVQTYIYNSVTSPLLMLCAEAGIRKINEEVHAK